jgi:hypothetical protein
VPAWAKELGDDKTSASDWERELRRYLYEDIVNGLLDHDGPLINGRRYGVAIIGRSRTANYVPGAALGPMLANEGMTSSPLTHTPHLILISKMAVLNFARRHVLPAPSWWSDNQDRDLRRADTAAAKQLADGARARMDHARRAPSAEPEQTENTTWRPKPGVRLTKGEAAVLEALKALWPNSRPDHNATARDNRIIKWLKERPLTPVTPRTIQRTLKKVDPPGVRDSS